MRSPRRVVAALLIAIFVVSPTLAQNDIEPEATGTIAALPEGSRAHWVWVSDRLFRHSQLFDGDSGRVLGTLDFSWSLGGRLPHTAPNRNELYIVESVYARGHRGQRSDYVTIYDADKLTVNGEVEIPPRAAETSSGVALTALLDDARFLVVYNQTPGSVSVVDVEARRFVGEIDAAGCACVYPTGPDSFGMLCGDGTALKVELEADGKLRRTNRSEKIFDVVADPLTEKGVRISGRWLFASFEGQLYDIDFAGLTPALRDKWSLFTDAERADGWRVGGQQHLALHRASGRLYSIVHKGGPGSHKDPGNDIWVYDIQSRGLIETIHAPSLVMPFIRPLLGIERGSGWYGVLNYASTIFGSPGVHSIAVTQDDEPLLFVRNAELGALAVLDARSGDHLRDIEEVGISGATMEVP